MMRLASVEAGVELGGEARSVVVIGVVDVRVARRRARTEVENFMVSELGE